MIRINALKNIGTEIMIQASQSGFFLLKGGNFSFTVDLQIQCTLCVCESSSKSDSALD